MIFRQLLEPLSSTYTYLLGCEETGQAVLTDPVIVSVERELAEVSRFGLTLAYSLDTHIHADHITAALELKKKSGQQDCRAGVRSAGLCRLRDRRRDAISARQHSLATLEN